MKFARGLMIVAYGLVAIASQTLLFREFVTAFEGNDIGVGVFFASWFLWVSLGALLVRRGDRFTQFLVVHIEPLFLLYIPAFVAQLLLILNFRRLAGAASYDLLSVQTIVLWSMVVNAPVSLVTGALFPLACRWIEQTHTFPVSRVYVLEAVGSFAGGLAVTALLAWHVPMVRVSVLLSLILSAFVAFSCLFASGGRRFAAIASAAMLASSAAVLATGTDHVLTRAVQAIQWSRLLPGQALQGAFQTAQAEYLYGAYGGQWIAIREGSVCEALPGEEEAGRTAAAVLCQNPQARRILVIGSGLALCNRLLLLPQIEHLAWAHPDAEYTRHLLEHLPPQFSMADARFHLVADEIRRYLEGARDSFDVVILSLSDVTGSTFNRYYTAEFYERIQAALHPTGVIAVGIPGGEDVMGDELVGLGASTRRTLGEVFANQVLVPGQQTWLIASAAGTLTGDPAVLRDRFASMAGSQRVFPAAGLLSVYLPDRAVEATRAYEKADLPERLLINRDSHPLASLYGLSLAARQSGASVTRFIRLLALSGWLPFAVPIFVFVALRVLAMTEPRRDGGPSSFDSLFLVFSTGWAAIAGVIVLMYQYETHFGSLYLHIGLVSSLFMAGLTVGALLVGFAISRQSDQRFVQALLAAALLMHAVVLAALATDRTAAAPGHAFFALAFFVAGLSCGGYWPIAAAQLAASSLNPGQAGSRLETADHLGACLGGLATSLLMVPVLGTRTSLLVLAGFVLANLPGAVTGLRSCGTTRMATETRGFRRAGYALFGVVACVVLCSNLLALASERSQPALPSYAVHSLAGDLQTRRMSAQLQSGRKAEYVAILDPNHKTVGYVLSSADFAADVRGFGGRFNLVFRTDTAGRLVDLLLVRSNETPSYLDLLGGWLDSLRGKPTSLPGVHAVSGATVSSEAILSAVRISGQRFAGEILQSGPSGGERVASMTDKVSLYFLATTILAFAAMWMGRAWGRLLVLVVAFFLGGVLLNAQYSTEQIATLLSFDVPRPGPTGSFMLAIGVPILGLLFGNLYCGYLCPFGAAQELVGYLVAQRLRPRPAGAPMRAARFIKYLVLAVFLIGFFVARDRRILGPDPLTSVFALPVQSRMSVLTLATVGVILGVSILHLRFWCRYLCPAGAFLSLLNRVRLLRRLVPAKSFGRCEFGLTASDHLDCLYCDRCQRGRRFEVSELRSQRGVKTPVLVAAALLGLFISGLSLNQLRHTVPEILQEAPSSVGAGGKPRDLDVRQMRTLIEQGRLSDREADHYRRLD